MKKYDETAPHEIMLTLDAGTGQNAISQAKLFHEAVGLTGITLTKLDGTAKGGVILRLLINSIYRFVILGWVKKLKIYVHLMRMNLLTRYLCMKTKAA